MVNNAQNAIIAVQHKRGNNVPLTFLEIKKIHVQHNASYFHILLDR